MQQEKLTSWSDEDEDEADQNNEQNEDEEELNQINLDDYSTDDQHKCRSCGASVSPGYLRVCGDNQGRVHRCPSCSSLSEKLHGGTAGVSSD